MVETIHQFYKRIQRYDLKLDAIYSKGKEYFNIFSRQCNLDIVQFSYRDFYKVTLIIGVGKLYYADKWILVDRPALLFSNPLKPYVWESVSEEQRGIFCIFNEQFVQSEEKNGSLANTPLFKLTGDKVFFLDESPLIFKLVNKFSTDKMKNSIPRYTFYKNKYGSELLIDVVELKYVKRFLAESAVHTLTYYDITFVTEGEGGAIDNRTYQAVPGDVFFVL